MRCPCSPSGDARWSIAVRWRLQHSPHSQGGEIPLQWGPSQFFLGNLSPGQPVSNGWSRFWVKARSFPPSERRCWRLSHPDLWPSCSCSHSCRSQGNSLISILCPKHHLRDPSLGQTWSLLASSPLAAFSSLCLLKCNEIKRCLLLGRKAVTNLDSILNSRDITLPTKVHLVKATLFPIVMYGCESWTIKKAECQKLMLLNCGVGEDSWESLGLQGDPTSTS